MSEEVAEETVSFIVTESNASKPAEGLPLWIMSSYRGVRLELLELKIGRTTVIAGSLI